MRQDDRQSTSEQAKQKSASLHQLQSKNEPDQNQKLKPELRSQNWIIRFALFQLLLGEKDIK